MFNTRTIKRLKEEVELLLREDIKKDRRIIELGRELGKLEFKLTNKPKHEVGDTTCEGGVVIEVNIVEDSEWNGGYTLFRGYKYQYKIE